MKRIMILSVLLVAGTAAAQFLPRGDASSISHQEARLFGSAICKAEVLAQEWGACEYLEQGSDPLLLFERGPALIPFRMFYGSFTRPGAQEVLVTLLYEGRDCCTERTVLFERTGRTWRPARLLDETSAPSYLVFTRRSGRALLVRRRDVSGLGVPFFDDGTTDYSLGFELSVTKVGPSQTTSSTLLDFSNPELNCVFPYASGARYAEVANWSRRDANSDGFPDLILDLKVTVLGDVRCEEQAFTKDPRQTEPMLKRLLFLYDGQHFRPTPKTELFKRYSQKPQSKAF